MTGLARWLMVPVMTRRRPPREPIERSCPNCHRSFSTRRSTQRFCGDRCRDAFRTRERRRRVHARIAELEAKLAELAGAKP